MISNWVGFDGAGVVFIEDIGVVVMGAEVVIMDAEVGRTVLLVVTLGIGVVCIIFWVVVAGAGVGFIVSWAATMETIATTRERNRILCIMELVEITAGNEFNFLPEYFTTSPWKSWLTALSRSLTRIKI